MKDVFLKSPGNKTPFVCWKVNSGKMNYFSMLGNVMKNKLENNF